MHKSGRYWKWLETVDKIFYEPNNIVRTIAPPKVVGNRGQFIFIDSIYVISLTKCIVLSQIPPAHQCLDCPMIYQY